MAEDSSGLDILISHRKQRPAFARMISQEFSRDSQVKPRRRRHSSKKKLSEADKEEESISNSDSESGGTFLGAQSLDLLDRESEDSDNSEYYSAEEYISQSELPYPTSFHSINVKDTKVEVGSISYIQTPLSVRDPNRAPNKRQKRKKGSFKLISLEVLPFTDANNFDLDAVENNFEENVSSSSSRCFPTLVELCLHKVWGPKSKKHLFSHLPPGIRPLVQHYHRDKSYFRLQLSDLHVKLAGSHNSDFLWYKNQEDGTRQILLKPTRNIWNYVVFTKYTSYNELTYYQKSKASSYLLHSSSSVMKHSDCYRSYQGAHAHLSGELSLQFCSSVFLPSICVNDCSQSFQIW